MIIDLLLGLFTCDIVDLISNFLGLETEWDQASRSRCIHSTCFSVINHLLSDDRLTFSFFVITHLFSRIIGPEWIH